MEEEDGTCSRPPFLPPPLSLLLPLPFICSSTQEPAGQPHVTHGHPALNTPAVYQLQPQGNSSVLGSDNTLGWESSQTQHRDSSARIALLSPTQTPWELSCCSLTLELLNRMSPFSPAINTLISHISLQFVSYRSLHYTSACSTFLSQAEFSSLCPYYKTPPPVQLYILLSFTPKGLGSIPNFSIHQAACHSQVSFSLLSPGTNISHKAPIYCFSPIFWYFYQWDIYMCTKIQQRVRVYSRRQEQLLKSSHTV